MQERKRFIDIAKGILILFVVLAHSPIRNYEPINWFHMPAFLILSGFTFSMPENFAAWLKKSSKRLLIPYASFYTIDIILMLSFVAPFTIVRLIKYIGGGLYSGRMIPGVFWFITTFFLMQIIFVLLAKTIKSDKVMIGVVFSAYLLAHFISSFYYKVGVYEYIKPLPITPWNIDVVPIMLFYFGVGFYGKKLLSNIFNKLGWIQTICLATIAVMFWIINDSMGLNYWLNLKYGRYSHLILDAIVPFVFTLVIVGISIQLEKSKLSKPLMLLGMYTFPIMYLHLPINNSLAEFIKVGPVLFMSTSIVSAFIFIWGIKNNKFMDFFFNGKGNIKEIFN